MAILLLIIHIACLVAIGIASGFYYVKLLKRNVLGGIWGACVVGVIGAVLGGELLRDTTRYLIENKLDVNFITTFFGAFFLIWILSKISHK
jgi:uncharacterized membrane protein YeaQ/YmgE (transglycosylase-associated protein family)